LKKIVGVLKISNLVSIIDVIGIFILKKKNI
jgi:hypothetical protein